MKEEMELKKIICELGEDWRENMSIINNSKVENESMLEAIKRLCKKGNQGNLVRIGLTLIAFPLPIVVDDVLGWSFLAAGLIQRKIKNSALCLEDINNTFPQLIRELQEIRREIG